MIDWRVLLVPEIPILEIIIRGTVMYLALFTLLRVILKRQSGDVGISDLLVVVLIADAAQNGLADDYRSVTEGIILVATIISWSFFLDFLGFHFPRLQRFLHPPPLQLISDGKFLRRNMRRELVSEDELLSKLRQEGLAGVEEVESAFMEGDGNLSFVPKNRENSDS